MGLMSLSRWKEGGREGGREGNTDNFVWMMVAEYEMKKEWDRGEEGRKGGREAEKERKNTRKQNLLKITIDTHICF